MLIRSLESMEQHPAPKGTSTTKKWLVGAFLALLAASGGYYWGEHCNQQGVYEGMKAILQLCTSRPEGGMIVDQDDGTVMICAPMPKVPKQELPALKST